MLSPLSDGEWSRRHADHLLNRAGFGGSPAEREALFVLGRDSGVAAAVDSLVQAVEDWSGFPLPAWAANFSNGDEENFPYHYRETQLVGWYMDQMRNASPLAAKMFKFYVDHFPVDTGTFPGGVDYIFMFKHLQLLRGHALGNFGTLVRGVSWSEAMMAMLNLDQSRRGNINENFGRELLELFTLGVNGGYTELDVNTVAAAFTGRMFRYPDEEYTNHPYEGYLNTRDDGYWDAENQIWYPDEYTFIDMTEKVLFGDPTPIPALELGQLPQEQGEEVITRILARPQCAVHMCWKLWRYFVEPEPSQGLQIALAQNLIGSGYEVRPLLRDIFLSEEFYASEAMGNQIKDPVELIVGFEKMLEIAPLPNATVSEMLEELGYTLYHPPNIAGWPEPVRSGNRWLSTGGMMFRLNLPALITHGTRDIFSQPWHIPDGGDSAPWVPEYPYPDMVDLDVVAPVEVRG
ncbi:MAG: DUF1800 family protein [Verrucomicrobiota bacterium]